MLRDRAIDPVVRGVLTVFLSDEIVHARIGWAYLAHAMKTADPGTRRAVAEVVPTYVAGLGRNLFGDDDAPAAVDVTHDDDRFKGHGVCSMGEEQSLYRSFVDEVFVPGLVAVGLDVDTAACRNAMPS
jgi:hypothetical protein